MKINQTPNGVIVLSKEIIPNYIEEKNEVPYKYWSWPLEYITPNKEAKEISDQINVTWLETYDMAFPETMPINVIPDFKTIKKYVDICIRLGVDIQTYLIYSERNDWFWNGPIFGEKIIGYDYTTVDLYPILTDDLLGNPDFPRREFFSNKLNKYRMFNSEEDLDEYVEQRKLAAKSGVYVHENEHDDFPFKMKFVKVDVKCFQDKN